MPGGVTRRKRTLGWLVAGVLAAAFALPVTTASSALADPDPVAPSSTPTVTADSLPTVQINGVVWAQVVVGNTVYATGQFTSARPAGAAAGTNETPRSNILAYDIRTGNLITGWAPTLNAQGMAIAASGDGTKIYVAGDFTSVSGVAKNRVVALDATSGAVISPFAASVNGQARALAVSGSTLYVGGGFTTSGGLTRNRLAAFDATNGALLAWNPGADKAVLGLAVPAGANKVVVGGRFSTLGGVANYGLGMVDATTGAALSFPANQVVRDAGDNSAIWSLSTDGTQIYGTGYTFGGGGNLESSFSTDLNGNLIWVVGCLGDNYDAKAINGVLYTVGHTHNCSQVASMPQTNPWTYQRAWAWTTGAGTHGETNLAGNFSGRAAPEQLHWLPTLDTGSYTGQTQAAWSIAGNSQYVVLGGEFPRVNYVAQQGLTRFAVKSLATNKQGPTTTAAELTPSVTTLGPGALRVSWQASWDRDSRRITYDVLRGGTVIASVQADSTWWNRPTVAYTDTSYSPGASVTYQIKARDSNNTTITGSAASFTAPSTSRAAGSYADAVVADGARSYWRLGESSGATAYDWRGADDLALANQTRGTAGALVGNADPATSFASGVVTSGVQATTKTAQYAPEYFSTEAWFRTTSTSGGLITGFGNSSTGDSGTADRQVYLSNNGTLNYGVFAGGTARSISTTQAYNNGQWHHVVATLGDAGMQLYVDGQLAGTRADTTFGQLYSGYWRVAGDAVRSTFPNRPARSRLAGDFDDVAVYPVVLSATRVAQHYQLARALNQSPTAAFTSSVNNLAVSFNGTGSSDADGSVASYTWDFGDGSSGTGATPSHTYASAGTFTVTLTVTDDQGATATIGQPVTTRVNQAPTASFTSSNTDLTGSFNASASSDPDGTVASYAWNFGDNDTGTGVSPTHTYASAGTYTVTLTVTDNEGGTGTTTGSVTVTAPPANTVIGADAFARTVAGGWGTADTGGAWTASGGTTSVAGGSGVISTNAGTTATLRLASVSAQDTDITHRAWVETVPTGGGLYWSDLLRRTSTGDYRAKLRVLSTGAVQVQFSKVVAGTETALTNAATVSGLTVTANSALKVRFQATGASPTTLRVKVWADGSAEPTAWTQTTTDSTGGLQTAGSVGFVAYTSSSATSPLVTHYDDLTVTRL